MQEQDRIIKINIEEEMKSSYIDYSMSVIVARALPDVRDGFKPVHRRILYRYGWNWATRRTSRIRKSARIVGEVLGKYHPARRFFCVRGTGAYGARLGYALSVGRRTG